MCGRWSSLRVSDVGEGLLPGEEAAQLQELPTSCRSGARGTHCGVVRAFLVLT